MEVEVERGIPLTANTVAELRVLPAWPPGDWVLDVPVDGDQRYNVVRVECVPTPVSNFIRKIAAMRFIAGLLERSFGRCAQRPGIFGGLSDHAGTSLSAYLAWEPRRAHVGQREAEEKAAYRAGTDSGRDL